MSLSTISLPDKVPHSLLLLLHSPGNLTTTVPASRRGAVAVVGVVVVLVEVVPAVVEVEVVEYAAVVAAEGAGN